jgi:hypothetical protein
LFCGYSEYNREIVRLEKKILLYWFLAFVGLRVAVEFPHDDFGWIGFINIFVQVLLALICFQIFRLSKGSQKPVWLNFTMLFGVAPLLVLSSYIGVSVLPGNRVAQFYTHLYVAEVFLPFMMLLSVVYLAADYFYRPAGTGRKYLLSVVVAIIALAPFMGRDAVSPVSLWREPVYQEYRTVKWHSEALAKEGKESSPDAVAASITAAAGWAGKTPGQVSERVNDLFPYLRDQNYTLLFWRPVHFSVAGVHAVNVGIILLLLVSIYRSGRPVQSYLDKILLVLGICGILEIFHNLSYAFSTTMAGYQDLLEAGQYFSIFFFLLLTGVFSLKLRFLARGAGRYYEAAIATHPDGTTRLIDDIDRLVLTTFFPVGRRGTLAHQQPTEHPEG